MNPDTHQLRQDYERVSYPGAAHAQTHPDRLATLATLFGMEPAPLAKCRVLEIGCTDGGNLIPMAASMPGAEFVGIDLCGRAVAAGKGTIAELGLTNIRLDELDLCELPADFGRFDYLIAHGVFSWVPAAVRGKLLAACRALLTPQGVAYISYNTYPGGYFRELARNMMLFATRDLAAPEEKRQQGLGLLQFIAGARPEGDIYGQVLQAELEWMSKTSAPAFHHDDLASTRSCHFFHEFVAEAEEHGLQYLAEASYFEMQAETFPPAVVEALRQLGEDPLAREQYLDFLKGRRFRQSLLCHQEVSLATPRGEQVRKLFVSSQAKAVSPAPVLDDGAVEEFTAPGNAVVRTGHGLTKAALLHLSHVWPGTVSFQELLEAACTKLGQAIPTQPDASAAVDLGDSLLAMYAAPIVELHPCPGRHTLEIMERPVVSSVVRLALARGEPRITNLRHASIRIEDEMARQLMLLLDGTRDRAALAHELALYCEQRKIVLQAHGTPARGVDDLSEVIAAGLEKNLRALARMAVLVP